MTNLYHYSLLNWANISEMVHDVTNVCMEHVYQFLYDISDYLMTIDLG